MLVSYRISLLTGHAITLSVTEKSVAAPGPSGVYATNPAPSFVLLPRMAGLETSAHETTVHKMTLTILATRPLTALSVVFENAVLLSGNGVNEIAGFVPLMV